MVGNSGVSVRVLPITAEEVAQLVERVRNPLRASTGGRIDLARAPFDAAAARALYDGLWKPLHAELSVVRRVSISPDGPIHMVPAHAHLPGHHLRSLPSLDPLHQQGSPRRR